MPLLAVHRKRRAGRRREAERRRPEEGQDMNTGLITVTLIAFMAAMP